MTTSYISPNTLKPARFGEIYTDRNIKLVGRARWNTGTNQVQTDSLSIHTTPINGGSAAVSDIPNGTYNLSAIGSSLWAKFRRTSGSTTVALIDIVEFTVGTQPTPREDWVQIFYRSATTTIVSMYGHVIAPGPAYTRIGVQMGNGIYDFIVGPSGSPYATHNDIQAAITDAVDGNRILILEGTYSVATAQNPAVDATAAISWSGKSLTLEGEGFNTVLVNGGAMTRAFAVQSTSATLTAALGNGSRIINLTVSGFTQGVAFLAQTFGIRYCNVDVWQINNATYTDPVVTGTGTSENNKVRLRVQSAALSPTILTQEYNLSNSRVRGNTDYDFQAKVRVGIANSIGRIKLPVYTTTTRTAATGLEEGEVFWDTTSKTLEVRDTSTFVSLAPLPIGSIISMGGVFTAVNNGGSYAEATTFVGVTIPANYKLCDGTLINETRSPLNTRYMPLLTDDRFLQGNSAGGLFAPTSPTFNLSDLSHTHPHPHSHPLASHTHPHPHTHNMPHVHPVTGTSGPTNLTITATAGPAGTHSHSFPHNHPIPSHRHRWMYRVFRGDGHIQFNTWSPSGGIGVVAGSTPFAADTPTEGLAVAPNRGNLFVHDLGANTESAGSGSTGNPSNPATMATMPAGAHTHTVTVTDTPHTHSVGSYITNASPTTVTADVNTAATGAAPGSTGTESAPLTGPSLPTTFDRRPRYLGVRYYMRIF